MPIHGGEAVKAAIMDGAKSEGFVITTQVQACSGSMRRKEAVWFDLVPEL